MQTVHTPKINARYWGAITFASIFGTNLGDLYAHDSGLGLMGGVPILGVLFLLIYFIEGRDKRTTELYYWLCILTLRTGATNIADYLAFRVHINAIALSIGLAAIIAVCAWFAARAERAAAVHDASLPKTNARYWVAMLSAGVFGTVLGDVCSHYRTQAGASLVLGALLAVVLFLGRKDSLRTVYYYWLTVAVARTAGTAMGDWLAENKILHIGLTVSTLITGVAFTAILLLWPKRRDGEAVAA